MKKRHRHVLVLVLVLSGVLFIFEISGGKTDVATEVSTLLAQQDEAWNRGDLAGFMSYYDDTGQLVFIGSGGAIRDRSVLQERYEKKYKAGESDFGKLSFTDLEVEELAPGLARAWGRWHLRLKEEELSGWFSLLLKKKPEGWRILHDHSS